jgi:hypothetical protein
VESLYEVVKVTSQDASNILLQRLSDEKQYWINQGHMRVYFGNLTKEEILCKYPEEFI